MSTTIQDIAVDQTKLAKKVNRAITDFLAKISIADSEERVAINIVVKIQSLDTQSGDRIDATSIRGVKNHLLDPDRENAESDGRRYGFQ